MAHLRSDMEHVDLYNTLEVCEIVIESATLVRIVFVPFGSRIYVAQIPLAPFNGEKSFRTNEGRKLRA
jgi:hypothetical protein